MTGRRHSSQLRHTPATVSQVCTLCLGLMRIRGRPRLARVRLAICRRPVEWERVRLVLYEGARCGRRRHVSSKLFRDLGRVLILADNSPELVLRLGRRIDAPALGWRQLGLRSRVAIFYCVFGREAIKARGRCERVFGGKVSDGQVSERQRYELPSRNSLAEPENAISENLCRYRNRRVATHGG